MVIHKSWNIDYKGSIVQSNATFPAQVLNSFDGALPEWWGRPINLLGAKVNIVFDAFVSAGSITGWPRSVVSTVESSTGEPVPEASFWRISQISRPPLDGLLQRGSATRLTGEYTYLGWLFGHYGHFLTESLNRFWYCLDDACPRRFLVHANYKSLAEFPSHVVSALSAFGITEKNLTIVSEPVIVERLHCPAPSLRCDDSSGLHLESVYRHLAKFFSGDEKAPGRRIFLSRSSLGNDLRQFNSDEIESVFRIFGFDCVYPELISFKEQVSLYSSSTWLAGPVGSGMHNAVFMPFGGTAMVIAPNSFLFRNDCLLAVGAGYDLRYHICENGPNAVVAQRPWFVEIEELKASVESWLTGCNGFERAYGSHGPIAPPTTD